MLSEDGYRRWHSRIGLSRSAIQVIDHIRSSPPSRRVSSGGGGARNVSGRFPSIKMRVVLQSESRTLERAFVRQADHDLSILEIWDQPPRIDLHYRTRGGRSIVAHHTPDYFVLWQDHAGWVECKPLAKLAQSTQLAPNRYCQDDSSAWICPLGIAYAKQFGLTYALVTEEQLDPIALGNYAYLEDYYRDLDAPPTLDPLQVERILTAVANEPGLTKAKLARFKPPISMDVLHWLIVLDEVYVDLTQSSLSDTERVHVYHDREQAEIYQLRALVTRPAWLADATIAHIEPGTLLVWDGKTWRITNVGDTRIYMQPQDGTGTMPIAMDRAQLHRLLQGNHITLGRSENPFAPEVQQDPAVNAHPDTLRRALKRYHLLQRFHAGDLSVHDEISQRALYGFQRRWRAAEAMGNPGITGLLDHSKHSGRKHQISDEESHLLLTSVKEDYGGNEQRTKRAAYERYRMRCASASMKPVSYETYRAAVNRQPRRQQTETRAGKCAAYPDTPFLPLFRGDRRGVFPLHICHIDHMLLDLELLSAVGENFGRPWLTMLMDAYSRRVLAFYLTYDPPSYRSCMMVVRECFRRHKRLPLILMLDNGKEFHSVYLETLAAAYEVALDYRPPSDPRFGAVIEKLLGTINSQLIHTLRGNTQIMQHVREVTKAVDPRNLAVWTLPALHDALSEYCYEVYEDQPHRGLHGSTPRAVFEAGQEVAGTRDHRLIQYNDTLLRLTEPTTPKGTARVSRTGVVKVLNVLYSCAAFREAGVPGANVPIRYDPENRGHIHAWVKGQFVECLSNDYDIFENRSEREIRLASAELRQADRVAGRTPLVTHSRLVTLLRHIEQHEAVLLQHRKDLEVRRARVGNAASFTQPPEPHTTDEWNGETPRRVGETSPLTQTPWGVDRLRRAARGKTDTVDTNESDEF